MLSHDPTAVDTPRSVVYYAMTQYRAVVKIGTAVDVERRMKRLEQRQKTPVVPIAIEPGGMELETLRHNQFRRYNAFGEWFWLSPELLSHIETLVEVAR